MALINPETKKKKEIWIIAYYSSSQCYVDLYNTIPFIVGKTNSATKLADFQIGPLTYNIIKLRYISVSNANFISGFWLLLIKLLNGTMIPGVEHHLSKRPLVQHDTEIWLNTLLESVGNLIDRSQITPIQSWHLNKFLSPHNIDNCKQTKKEYTLTHNKFCIK